ncbi:Rab GTPase-binding effector protein 1 [Armadillidium nasatum]|uniref:Rab GTPase-binding effector protein 1 n=1 Tax=Armadillidium nasatum TaxID=96803 RepID=A0A5N5SJD0_9CRUS|nr:Rab GTPase-binding effector protein 1 [Armadillidium nasatum]
MREELTSAENEIQYLKSIIKKLEKEKHHYRSLYEKLIEDSDLKKEGFLSQNVISAVTKSISKRVPSLSPAHSPNYNTGSLEEAASHPLFGNIGSSGGGSLTPVGGSTTPVAEHPISLEDSMRKAQEDAAVLRSLVVPLEEEIRALKDKIREQDTQLRMHESQQQMDIKTAEVLAPLFQGKSADELVQELDEKLKGMKMTLEVEKASRADLELYTAILNTQKTALTDTIDRLREQLAELRQSYDEERKEHMELKNTWQRANDEFLEAQRIHLADTRCIQSLLTSEQLRKLYDLQRIDSKDEEPLANLSEDKEPKEEEGSPLLNFKPRTEVYLTNSQEDLEKQSSDETESTLLDSSEGLDSNDENAPKDASTLLSKYSPEKMPQLTDDQKHALSAISSEKLGECSSLTSSDSTGGLNAANLVNASQRVVSEVEWCRLQEEIKKSRLRMTATCPLCLGFESQLRKVQNDLKELEREHSNLEMANTRQREDLDREAQYRKQTEAEWKQKAEEYDKREKELQVIVDKLSSKHTQIVSWSKKTVHITEEKLKRLTENREAVHTELTRLQRENDNLVGKHSQHSQELQNEIINLPDTMEGMQLLLLRYREDVIAAKVAKEQLEETSNSKILFLKDQILKEQHEKSSIEDILNSEIDQLKSRIVTLERKESRLEEEIRQRTDAETKLNEIEQKALDSSVKSQQMISSLKQKVDEQTQSKSRTESEIQELRSRVASLQHDLEMSEAVQRDFVRLSQSLQVQLEKIRQSEKEVRWQHEDDIEECNNCKQRFTAVGRRKPLSDLDVLITFHYSFAIYNF